MIHRIEIAIRKGLPDPRGEHVAARVRDFLDIPIDAVRTRDVYHLEADLSEDELATVVREFTDPVLNVGAAGRIDDGPFDSAITVAYKPGVADPIGKSARVAIEDTLGRTLGDEAAREGFRIMHGLQQQGLQVDGVAGPETMMRLNSVSKRPGIPRLRVGG